MPLLARKVHTVAVMARFPVIAIVVVAVFAASGCSARRLGGSASMVSVTNRPIAEARQDSPSPSPQARPRRETRDARTPGRLPSARGARDLVVEGTSGHISQSDHHRQAAAIVGTTGTPPAALSAPDRSDAAAPVDAQSRQVVAVPHEPSEPTAKGREEGRPIAATVGVVMLIAVAVVILRRLG
jgi:hypothetical protein